MRHANENDVILLNSNRTQLEQKFSCGHEFLHLVFHRDEKRPSFKCYDKIQPGQNAIYEWHANEGAAELFVPYKIFIPRYVALSRQLARSSRSVISPLARKFNVTEGVIKNRIKNLNYEICCYLEHENLADVRILSMRKLAEIGWRGEHERWYCRKCFSVIGEKDHFCSACGCDLTVKRSFFNDFRNKDRGVGYMIYNGIEVDKNSKAKKCPICQNEEVQHGD